MIFLNLVHRRQVLERSVGGSQCFCLGLSPKTLNEEVLVKFSTLCVGAFLVDLTHLPS